jgi:hypothetical protein
VHLALLVKSPLDSSDALCQWPAATSASRP